MSRDEVDPALVLLLDEFLWVRLPVATQLWQAGGRALLSRKQVLMHAGDEVVPVVVDYFLAEGALGLVMTGCYWLVVDDFLLKLMVQFSANLVQAIVEVASDRRG